MQMRKAASTIFSLAAIIIFCARMASAVDLGERELWNALGVPDQQWKAEKGISVSVEPDMVVVRSGEVDFGWATPNRRAPFVKTATLDVELKQIANGQLGVQVEWFKEDGTFISYTNILQQAKSPVRLSNLKLSDLVPTGEKPKKFGLKFWIEGRNAEARISEAVAQFARSWRNAGTRTLHAYDAKASVTSDEGMEGHGENGVIVARLSNDKGYSAFVLEDRADYDPNGVVMLDLEKLEGGTLTVQALCWDKDGTFLKAVDVIKDVAQVGVIEIPFTIYVDQFPKGTARVSFKIWLSGRGASATIAGLFYGVTP